MMLLEWIPLILIANFVFPGSNEGFLADTFHESNGFDDLFMKYMRERKVPGANVAVAKKGKIIIKKGFGRASQQRLMTPWTVVRIGEVSKVLTAVGVLRLVEMGKITLDQSVFGEKSLLKEYSNEIKDQRIRDITIRHLLQHTSGWNQKSTGDSLLKPGLLRKFIEEKLKHKIQSVYYDPGLESKSPNDEERFVSLLQRYSTFSESYNEQFGVQQNQTDHAGQGRSTSEKNKENNDFRRRQRTSKHQEITRSNVVKYFIKQPLHFDPGTRYSYLNFGYMVLGLIIERSTQRSYESFMRELLSKVGIYRMKVGRSNNREGDISEVEYFPSNNEGALLSSFNGHSPFSGESGELVDACCGWISSASDLITFFDSLFHGKHSSSKQTLLSNATFVQMTTRPGYSGTKQSWYGLGLVVEDGGRSLWHGGSLEGSTSVLYRNEQDYSWAILLNCKLHPNDLADFMKYAIRQIVLKNKAASHFLASHQTPQYTLPYTSQLVNDIDEFQEASPRMKSYDFSSWGSLYDVISEDETNVVKIMIPDFKLHEFLDLISSKLCKPTWFDAYENPSGQIYFNVIWTKNDDPYSRWRMYFDLIPSRYRRRYNARVAQGYRLAHVETYVSKKKLRYAALFVKDDWPDWITYEGYSPARHKAEFYRMLEGGYRLVVQSVAEFKGRLYVAAIYDKFFIGDGRVRLGLTLEQLNDELNRQVANGQILSYVQAYTNRDRLKFSAIWSPRISKQWAVSPAMTKYTLLNRLYQYSIANVPVACLSSYHTDGITYFVALWR